MIDFRISPLKDEHLPQLWGIIQGYDYFDDIVKMDTLEDFKMWMKKNVVEGLVGIKGDEIIGCGYLSNIHKGLGEINIFVKRRSIKQNKLVSVIKDYLMYFFIGCNLRMIYGIVRKDNKACLRLMQKVGFKTTTVMEKHERIKNVWKDCIMAVILREEVL